MTPEDPVLDRGAVHAIGEADAGAVVVQNERVDADDRRRTEAAPVDRAAGVAEAGATATLCRS
jgi:hypothetical protein